MPPLLARPRIRLVRVVSPGDALVQATVTLCTSVRCAATRPRPGEDWCHDCSLSIELEIDEVLDGPTPQGD